MRVLVTGSSGFIGTSFLEVYAGKAELFGIDRCAPGEPVDGVQYHELDLAALERLGPVLQRISPNIVVHLAAQARVEPSLNDPIGTYRDNVVATVNLIQAAVELGSSLQMFVYASSETIYGPAIQYPTPESASPNPQSPYAASKVAAESLVRAALKDRSVVVRSGMGYGPRSNPKAQVVARFVQRALRDEPLKFPASTFAAHPTRDVNYVTNFVDGVRLAIESGASGTFNIASGRETSVLDLAKAVIRKAGAGRIDFDPSWTYREGEEGLRTWLDISKARDAFGYRPRVDLEEGLERTVSWMRSHSSE